MNNIQDFSLKIDLKDQSKHGVKAITPHTLNKIIKDGLERFFGAQFIEKTSFVLQELPQFQGRDDVALLAIIKDGKDLESVTVFVPYVYKDSSSTRIPSFWGDVDIIFSYGSTYKITRDENSSFHTGEPLVGESFQILPKQEALNLAKEIYKNDRQAKGLRVY